jgi:hypothetical protein
MDEYFRQMASSKNAPNDQTNSTDDEASNESDSEDNFNRAEGAATSVNHYHVFILQFYML